MTAKLTARQIRERITSHVSRNSLERAVPDQTILKLYSSQKALMKCASHGQYLFTAQRLVFSVGRLGPCPDCKAHYFANREYRIKKVSESTLLKQIQKAGLTYIGPKLTKETPISSTELSVRCIKCKEASTVTVQKFIGWKTKGERLGCAWCRNNNPRWYTHAAFLKELKEKHGDSITPLFTFDKKTSKHEKRTFRCDKGHEWNTRPVLVAREGHGCRFCAAANNIHSRCVIEYKRKGTVYRLDSAGELFVLKRLLKKFGEKSVERNSRAFEVYGRGHRYYPDFFMPSKDLYLEVKSVATLGLTTYRGDRTVEDVQRRFEKVRSTFHSLFATDCKIRLIVAHKRDCTTLPEDWFTWPYSEVASFLRMRGHRIPPLSDPGESTYSQMKRAP